MILKRLQKLVPEMSATERQALEAGTVWIDGDLFSGRPDFGKGLHLRRDRRRTSAGGDLGIDQIQHYRAGAQDRRRRHGRIGRRRHLPRAAQPDSRRLHRRADEDSARRVLERAFELTVEAAPIERRLRQAIRDGRLPKRALEDFELAAGAGLLEPEARQLLERAAAARLEAIQVDDFSEEELVGGAGEPESPRPVAVGA